MTAIHLCIIVLFGTLLLLPSNAWISSSPSSQGLKQTRLYMFDWFNPKKPEPKKEEEKPKMEEEKKEEPAPVAASAEKVEETAAAEPEKKEEPAADDDAIHSGTVRFFVREKGYGFIDPADGGRQVFVHQSEIQAPGFRYLVDGEEVEYGMIHDDQGRPRAVHVTGPKGGNVKVTTLREQGREFKSPKKDE